MPASLLKAIQSALIIQGFSFNPRMNLDSCDSLVLDFITDMLFSHPGRREMKKGKNILNAKTTACKHKVRLTQNKSFGILNNCI